MKIFKIKISSINILPFGSIINSDINYNIKSIILFFVSAAGIIFQLILYFIFYCLNYFGLINYINYDIFLFYNKMIIIFNLLPIIPLDGSKMLLSLFELIFPYKMSLKIINIISIVTIIIFFFCNKINLNMIVLTAFLFFKTYIEIMEHKSIFNKFLLERYLYKIDYKKVKKVKNIDGIYKNKHNFIENLSEYKLLKNRYKYN